MKIAIGSDHAGYEVKQNLIEVLHKESFDVIDFGTNSLKAVDYPFYAKKVGECIAQKKADLGILICGTGVGICIAANKVKGVRAALLYSEETALLAKKHNDANVICFGSRTFSIKEIKKMLNIFLSTQFEQRHTNRIALITDIEEGK